MLNKLYIKNLFSLSIKIVAILILYQFCRLLFFFYNLEYFSNINLIDYLRIIKGSIRFDISAIDGSGVEQWTKTFGGTCNINDINN